MKTIAIPTRGKEIEDHFGQCAYYTIIKVTDNKVVSREEFETHVGCGCKSNLTEILADKGVGFMIAGNMGQGAVNKISQAGIQVYRGCSGDVRELVEAYLEERVKDSGTTCAGHGESDGHVC